MNEEDIEEKEEAKEEDLTIDVTPEICSDHDDEKYHIEIGLPGVKKEDIDLTMGGNHFCLKAPKGDITYNACYTLAHLIDPTKVTSSFENGELVILAPFAHSLKGVKIPID